MAIVALLGGCDSGEEQAQPQPSEPLSVRFSGEALPGTMVENGVLLTAAWVSG
jgi:hypothetical protein